MLDFFTFRNHKCITFELLNINLYELIKKNKFQGFSLMVSTSLSSWCISHCLLCSWSESLPIPCCSVWNCSTGIDSFTVTSNPKMYFSSNKDEVALRFGYCALFILIPCLGYWFWLLMLRGPTNLHLHSESILQSSRRFEFFTIITFTLFCVV